MSELPPKNDEDIAKEKIEGLRAEIVHLATELAQNPEGFPFPGMDPGEIEARRASDVEYAEFSSATPIDQLLLRFQNEGMKVSFGAIPTSANVYVLPRESNNIEADGIFPRQLQIESVADERLRKLILLHLSLRHVLHPKR